MKDLATKNTKDTKKVWPKVRLGDVCEEIRERISSSKVSVECYVTTDNMVKGCGGVRVADNVPESVGLVCYQKGDVLLSNIRPYLKKSWLADRDGGCSNDVIVFRSLRSDLSPEYLFRVLSQDGFFDYSMQNVSGTKMPRGKRDWIKSFQFPLPPLSVQREIVARLEKELGEADKLAAKFKRVAELADDAFKAELDETFKALEDNSRRDAETRRVRLGDVCEIKNGYTPKKDGLSEEGDIPYFRISSMNFPENLKMLDSPNAWLRGHWRSFKKGSIVFPKNGGAVYTGKVRVLSQDSVVDLNTGVCTPNSDCAKDYLYFWFTQIDIKRAIVEGTIPFVDFGKLADFLIPLPHLAAQRAIVAKLDAAKERCEKLKAAAMRGHAAAENLRKAILAEAFEQ